MSSGLQLHLEWSPLGFFMISVSTCDPFQACSSAQCMIILSFAWQELCSSGTELKNHVIARDRMN